MSFQAYLDNIKTKTGKSADDFIVLAKTKGLLDPKVKAGEIVDWLKKEYELGHGHSMAIYAVFKTYLENSSKAKKDKEGVFSFLAQPAQRALESAGITTLKQLSKITEDELNGLHGIGKNATVQLKDLLSKNRLSLAKSKK